MYSYTRPIWAMHNLYKLALALRVLFYFLRSLYIYSSPYSTRDTHYRLIKYITFRVLLYVTHLDYLAVPTIKEEGIKAANTILTIISNATLALYTRNPAAIYKSIY